MNRSLIWAVLLALVVICASSCATITRGSNDVLVVNSDPTGAKVMTSNGLSGTTPATFKVNRRGGFVVKIEKDGYEPVEVQIGSKIHGAGGTALAGNILLGGLIGAAVDASTGAAYDLVPNPVNVKLVALSSRIQQTAPVVNTSSWALPSDGTTEPSATTTANERARAAEALAQVRVDDVATHQMPGAVTADLTIVNENAFPVNTIEVECTLDGVHVRSRSDDNLNRGIGPHGKVRYFDVSFGDARNASALANCWVRHISIPASAVSGR